MEEEALEVEAAENRMDMDVMTTIHALLVTPTTVAATRPRSGDERRLHKMRAVTNG